MPPRRTPDDHDGDDRDLFRAAVGPVRALPDSPTPPAAPKPRPRARMAELDEADARQSFRHALDDALLEAADTLSYRSDALPVHVFARLKRGEIAVQEELDLHGTDARTAEPLLRAFLNDARQHGVGCVGVIHGKGRHGAAFEGRLVDSRGAPVLKNLVDRMLRQRADVLGFHSAPAARGGTGAVTVLLAPPKRR